MGGYFLRVTLGVPPGCFVTLFRFGQEIAIRWTRIDTRQYRLVSLKYFIQQPHLNGLKSWEPLISAA